jgi:hypothetical protein
MTLGESNQDELDILKKMREDDAKKNAETNEQNMNVLGKTGGNAKQIEVILSQMDQMKREIIP